MVTVDAEAARFDVTIDQGDDETVKITRQKSDGTAHDITGWTFWWTIKSDRSLSDANAEVQKTVTSHTTPTSGITNISLSPSDTEDLTGNHYHDIQEKTDTGTVNTILKGQLYVETDTTNSTS